uniref:hypothetical protein n=1 Tax=Levilactobacillus brevis TaxID=1580 RepID=UPI000551B415
MINSKTVLLTSLGLFLGSGVCIANADSTRVSPSITQSQVVTSVQGKNSYRKTISVTLQNNNSLQTQTASDSETQPKTNSQKQTASDSETQPKTNSQTQTASDSETQPKTNSQKQTAS